ncbi:hypothetical protein Bca4012_083087 [Brassica carinata]|uniref:E3 ubiquitin-protein ligase Sina-like RING finger domain-containing protein n=1 Tax=Brassica carinata TaxID=52824 RepID=A0A8X8ALJ9_BRACI|nr:hypothetical protein Bca52824_027707 [Brassica carinata]
MVGASSISETSDQVNGSSSIPSQKRNRSSISSGDGAKKRSLMLLDADLLDCPICYLPLTIPIFQCDNGHLACSSCCPKLRNNALPVLPPLVTKDVEQWRMSLNPSSFHAQKPRWVVQRMSLMGKNQLI